MSWSKSPFAYNPLDLTTKENSTVWTLGKSHRPSAVIKGLEKVPGPNAYSSTKMKSASVTMHKKLEDTSLNERKRVPGVGSYNV